VIQLPPSAVPRLVQTFQGDFFLDEAAVRAAYQPPYQFNAIDERSSLKVGFWLLRLVPFEREMFARRKQVTLVGELAWLATAEDEYTPGSAGPPGCQTGSVAQPLFPPVRPVGSSCRATRPVTGRC
jgi:hypothetical protein